MFYRAQSGYPSDSLYVSAWLGRGVQVFDQKLSWTFPMVFLGEIKFKSSGFE